jgi:hypothetical protein
MIENSNLANKTALVKAIQAASQSEVAMMKQKAEVLTMQLQVANMKAEVSKIEADALLKRSKAAHAVAQTQELVGSDPSKDAEMQLEQQKHEQEMQHDSEKHAQDLEHDKQKHEQDSQLKRAQAIMAMRQQPKESVNE